VLRATDDVAGVGAKTLVDTPLSLKVYGPLLHDLTLIDLPGIIVLPLPGEKHVQHRNMFNTKLPPSTRPLCCAWSHVTAAIVQATFSCTKVRCTWCRGASCARSFLSGAIPLALNHMDLHALQASRQTSRISR